MERCPISSVVFATIDEISIKGKFCYIYSFILCETVNELFN